MPNRRRCVLRAVMRTTSGSFLGPDPLALGDREVAGDQVVAPLSTRSGRSILVTDAFSA